MKKTYESREDYLERILMLQESGIKEVHAVDLANALGFSKPSVSIALKKLENEGFVALGPKQQLYLTPSGQEIASKIYERHKILTDMFIALGVNEEVARIDACSVEHDLSDETFAAIKAHYENMGSK